MQLNRILGAALLVNFVACAAAVAFDPIRVVAVSGTPVPNMPAGQTFVMSSFDSLRCGAGGHAAFRVTTSGSGEWNGVYVFGPEGNFLNRMLDSEREFERWRKPIPASVSIGGATTVIRKTNPDASAFSNNWAVRLNADGTRVEFAPPGSTVPGTGERTVVAISTATSDARYFDRTLDDADVFAFVRLTPTAIDEEIVNGVLIRLGPDGTTNPVVVSGNVAGGESSVTWPVSVADNGAFLYRSSIEGASRLRRVDEQGLQRTDVIVSFYPLDSSRRVSALKQALTNSQGDVYSELMLSTGTAFQELKRIVRRAGVWSEIPLTWQFETPAGLLTCGCVSDATLLNDGSLLYAADCLPNVPSTLVTTDSAVMVTPQGQGKLLSVSGNQVILRSLSVRRYGQSGRLAPTSLADVHVAVVGSTLGVIARDTDGELIALAAEGDTFMYNNLSWRITQATSVWNEGTSVIFIADAAAPGQPSRQFVLRTGLAGPTCGNLDFNNDGVWPDERDVIDFFDVYAGGACPSLRCDTLDFNRNGVTPEDQDVIDFFNVLAGGTCN